MKANGTTAEALEVGHVRVMVDIRHFILSLISDDVVPSGGAEVFPARGNPGGFNNLTLIIIVDLLF